MSLRFPKPTKRSRPPRRIRRRKTLAAVRAELKAEGPGVSAETWAAILAWYSGLCAYCQEAPGSTRDHVVPLSRGGEDSPGNLVPSCLRCNLLKGTRRVSPARIHPFRAGA